MKRLLSVIIAMAMILAMIPAVFAADTETDSTAGDTGVKIVYPFYLGDGGYDSTTVATPDKITYENSGYRVAFGAHNSTTDFTTPFTWDGNYALIRLSRFGSGKKNFYYKINVPKEGTYDITLDYVQGASGSPSVAMYIFAGDVESVDNAINTASSSVFSALDFNATSNTEATASASYTFSDAGEYIVAWRNTRTTAQSGDVIRLKQLIFTGGDNSTGTVIHAEMNLDKTALDKANGDTAVITLKNVYMSDGSEADASGVTYVNSDENVVTVSGNTVTPVARGTATIYAMNRDYVLDEETVAVTNSNLCGVKAVYPFYLGEGGYDAENVAKPYDIAYSNSGYRIGYLSSYDYYATPSQWNNDVALLNVYRSTSNAKYYTAFKIMVPKAGTYDINLEYVKSTAASSDNAFLYILPMGTEDIGTAVRAETNKLFSSLDFNSTTGNDYYKNVATSYTFPSSGEYIIAWRNAVSTGPIRPRKLTLNGGTAAGLVGTVSAENSTLEVGGTTTVSATLHDAVTGAELTGVTFESSDPETVSVNGTTLTAEKAGSAIITANAEGYESYVTTTVTVNAPAQEENEPLVDEFVKEENKEDITSSYVAPSITAITLNGKSIVAEKNTDGTYNLTAPETDKKFLYWAMALTNNKRIVSFSETLENYIPEGNYRNYLVPVYEGDVAADKEEFYNQNGQLIPDANESTTVSMPGYGSTSTWKKYGDTNIYVADYGKTAQQKDNVTVTVVGGQGTATVAYGTEVTCTAAENDGDGNPFKCWKKTVGNTTEIVSVDSAYAFKAWKNCTVTAVYEAHTPIDNAMKIIIDNFAVGSDTGVMAEFIGLDDAVEKGIMFTATGATEATKIAMTTKDSQFTVIADADGEYTGYAIVENVTGGYTLITDGSYTK